MAKIRENEPLPPHTRLSYDECYAKLILEKIFPNRYENLQLSDKPDLRDLKHNIGIEVTSVIPKEEQEALNLAAMMPYVNEQSQERRRKRLKKLDIATRSMGWHIHLNPIGMMAISMM
ncbi:hypothetical protein [Anaerobutyricum hallii]|uniref:hypothetical protein n=1 Tax=Anaerobutyricum hallii TaxID=39488 RepID=UPI003A8466D7